MISDRVEPSSLVEEMIQLIVLHLAHRSYTPSQLNTWHRLIFAADNTCGSQLTNLIRFDSKTSGIACVVGTSRLLCCFTKEPTGCGVQQTLQGKFPNRIACVDCSCCQHIDGV